MPTDLSPAEKDDRQVERLIDKKPAPSRKPAGRGAPKHDNRRRRMKDHTEQEKTDKDLSRKTQASRLLAIAARVAVTEEEEIHKPFADPGEEAHHLVNKFSHLLGSQSLQLQESFDDFAKKEYAPIILAKVGKPGKGKLDPAKVMREQQEELVSRLRKLIGIFDRVSRTSFKGSPADVAAQISELWPNGKPHNWATRGGILAALEKSIKGLNVPASIKANALKEAGNKRKGAALIADLLKEAKGGQLSEDKLSDRTELATLTAAYRILLDNPDTIDVSKLVTEVDEETKRVYGELQKLMALPEFMKSWDEAVKEIAKMGLEEPEKKTSAWTYYGEVEKGLQNLFKADEEPPFPIDEFIDGLEAVLGKGYKDAPKELKEVVEGYRSAATSYDALRGKAMGQRTATFHGVNYHDYPDGPYPGYRSYDKRYFGKEHYDSIVAHAKELLKEDWLKYEWDSGAKDAPYRAALDMSIHLADSNLYQAKIDGETYNMLLARLMGDKTDVFTETLITNEDRQSRRASAMSNQHYQAILRIASQLRQENPRAAFEIVKNLRSIVAQQEQQEEEEQQGHAGQQQQSQQQSQQQQGQQQQGQREECGQEEQQQQQQGQQQQVYQQQQQGQITDKDMDEFVEGKVDIKDLKDQLKQVVDAKSIEDFVDGLTSMDEVLKKTASRVAAIMDLEPLEDMDEEQVKAFLDKQKAEAQKLFQENDIEKFMEGVDALFSEAEKAAKSVKTGSVTVAMSALVRLAHSNPEARPVLLPIIVAAAKKKKKKEKRKKDKADKKKGKKPNPFAKGGDKAKGGKGGKKPPFGGKKAPPFGGKKAPPFGKKKSSVDIDPSDTNW